MDLRNVSIVTTPAASYDLTTLEAMKVYLAIPDSDTSKDAFLSDRITKNSTAIQRHCNNQFVQETRTDNIYPNRGIDPWQVQSGIGILQMARWPIISITSVTTLAQASAPIILVEGTDFITLQETGQLLRLSSQTGYQRSWEAVPTVVVYVAGYATTPGDVEDACQRMVEKSFWSRGRDPSIIEQNQGMVGATRYWVSTGAEGNMPPEIADLLDAYRVPVFR